MEIYLVIVVILFILAISDLMVGVSNDAVNFLNSAIGSKVAPRYIIMIVASLGILVGTTFSSGLMEVARKGIFNPQFFYLNEIMVVFLAVMITDVLLLDLYNTFALPTSTTVSIVFELLGAAVAVSLIKIANSGEGFGELVKYINTSKAFAIISGILLSVVISFTVGAIIQFVTRLIFTFDYKKRFKRYGAIWGGVALTAITFFILIKGAKGSSLLTSETQTWIKNNSELIIIYSFIAWTILLQLIQWFTKINILKPIVLIGTFALALAFAANDLVNFIGVPLAGLATYNIGAASSSPFEILMVALTQKVPTPTLLLLLAGGVMVVTLWINKKSRSVTKTEVNLGRQSEGFERFESTLLSRKIVGMTVGLNNVYKKVVPSGLQKFISNRFNSVSQQLNLFSKGGEPPAFDLIRASVNLMVASMLISFATSLKLPLSTTYVTFMVAMGTSLSDKAWGRESAVYRVTGVITVIGGWFLTAVIAFTVAGIFAVIIFYGELPAIIVLSVLAAFFIYKTHVLHKRRTVEEDRLEMIAARDLTNEVDILKTLMVNISSYLGFVKQAFESSIEGINSGNIDKLRETKKVVKLIKKNSNFLVAEIMTSAKKFPVDNKKTGRRYGKIIANIQEIYIHIRDVNQRCLDHIDNNHTPPAGEQVVELNAIKDLLGMKIDSTVKLLDSKEFVNFEEYSGSLEEYTESVTNFDENQLNRISTGTDTTRNSLLFLEILSDSENISNHLNSLVSLLKKNYDKFQPKTGE
jgi:phosphate/sulfate permease